ncbi:MAG: hypothetical protein J6V44_17280 [Methanobrevibacter sp.]|nr:hypothetical protein [Methanobrevibacter sp.]
MNNDIFINSSHVVKIEKIDTDKIKIDMSYNAQPVNLEFNSESERNVIFNKLVMEMYGNNYAYLDFELKQNSSTMSD